MSETTPKVIPIDELPESTSFADEDTLILQKHSGDTQRANAKALKDYITSDIQIPESSSAAARADFAPAWIWWNNNLIQNFGDIETAAAVYAKHDIIATARSCQWNKLDAGFSDTTKAIIKRAKELNPRLRVFEYIEAESARDDFKTADGEYAHLNPDGSWEGSTADISGSNRIFTRKEIDDMMKSIKNVNGSDGIFFDDFGYDWNKDWICYQMGYDTADFANDTNNYRALNRKFGDLIQMCHENGLSVITNGSLTGLAKIATEPGIEWYSYFDENDITAFESCMVTSENPHQWKNGQDTLYTYLTQYYNTGKSKAKAWSQDYLPAEGESLRQKTATYLYAMGLASGAHYVSVGVNDFYDAPWFIEEMTKGKQRKITKTSTYMYSVTNGNHTLLVEKPKLSGELTEAKLDRVKITYDGNPFNNAYISGGSAQYTLGNQIEDVQAKVDNMTSDSRANAISYWRMIVDDWQSELTLANYHNYFAEESWRRGAYGNDTSKVQGKYVNNDDGTIDFVITAREYLGDGSNYLHSGDISVLSGDSEVKGIVGMKAEMGYEDIVFDLTKGDDYYVPENNVYVGTGGSWVRPGFVPAFHNNRTTTNNGEKLYFNPPGQVVSELAPAGSQSMQWTITDDDRNSIFLWFVPPKDKKVNGTITFKNIYLINLDEHADEIQKKWYTNIFKVPTYNGGVKTTAKPMTTKLDRPLYNTESTTWDSFGSDKFSLSTDDVVALRGHTLELGVFDYKIWSDKLQQYVTGAVNKSGDSGANFRLRISITDTSGTSTYDIFTNTKKTSAWDEAIPCTQALVTDSATDVSIIWQNNGIGKDAVITCNGIYLYDLDEDVAIRGKTVTNASLRFARVTEEEEAKNPAKVPNGLFISDKGRMWLRDLAGEKTDITGAIYYGAVQAGYDKSAEEFGAELFQLLKNGGASSRAKQFTPIAGGSSVDVIHGTIQKREDVKE